MKKNIHILVAGLLMAVMALAPVAAMAQDKPEKPKAPAAGSAADKPDQPAANARPVPFRGTVAAVDKQAKTVTVGERVFHISSDTRLIKGSQPATVADIVVGDVIAGNFTKGDDGKLTAKMIRFGLKPANEEKKPVGKKKENTAEQPPIPK